MCGVIRLLEEVGFLDRAVMSGSTHKPTPDGLRRKPILFMFGGEFCGLFEKANKRAQEALERRSHSGSGSAHKPPRTPVRLPEAWRANSPKNRVSEAEVVLMGGLSQSL